MIFKEIANDVNRRSFSSFDNLSSFFILLFSSVLRLAKKNFFTLIFLLICIIIVKGAFLSNSPQFAELSGSIASSVIK